MRILRKISLLLAAAIYFTGCKEVAVPKPRGYFRIDLPVKEYVTFNASGSAKKDLPLTFEYPSYGKISFATETKPEPGWFNIEFPFYRAKIYLTYKNIKNNLDSLMDQTYRMNVKNHISKADAIDEQVISDRDRKVYGILYDLKGSTATAVQFFVTDSTKHFLRGSLYFASESNPDSLGPVINFFREDINHMIETLRWKDK